MPVTATPTRAAEFREALAQRVWVADGAMGTMLSAKLYSNGAFINRSYDELNLSLPALVRDVHQEYIRAGSELIETNTFGANRKRLAPFGFADKVRLINRAGVRIAREAARRDESDQAFVAAAIGPLGVRVEPLGSTTMDEARSIFREQIETLVEAGVDCLMIETFRDLNEVRAAVEAAREAAGPDMVIMAHLSIGDDGLLQDGTSVEDFTLALDAMPVDVIGLNCSSGPSVMLDTLERMSAYTNKPLSALPNAGLGKNLFLPEYMAACAARFVQAGASIVGGCCGTTPVHIKEIRDAVRDAQPVHRATVVLEPEAKAGPMEKLPLASKSELGAKLAAGTFVSLVEILPPRGLDASQEIAAAKLYKESGFDCIVVSDGPRSGARLSAQVACQLIQRESGIDAALHVHGRDRDFLRIQNKLLSAYKVGIRNLICSTSDGVAAVAGHLNRGLDLGGNRMGSQAGLVLGVKVNPGAYDMDDELRRFESGVQAGAEFAVTEPIFSVDSLEGFLKFGIPVIAGIWPLTGFRNADFMVNELRIPVPEPYMERMRRADNAETARAEGVAIAQEMVKRVRPLVAGIQLSAPLGQYQTAIDVAEVIER
jgi:methionine synthase I (cobalamin-dependent)/5,10-methylenetetrahydrofolate reductase